MKKNEKAVMIKKIKKKPITSTPKKKKKKTKLRSKATIIPWLTGIHIMSSDGWALFYSATGTPL